ncbi:MAG: phosphopantothenoylcysteine decarboxylase [Verrucomicrobia bacterium]|nr:phosphopantothenoylcysteine decarboxylase [Verrucomicrobiota bacterium]
MKTQNPTLLVTIGPTQEPLDAMRLISNRSTGNLGTLLALRLIESGHSVIALRGVGSTAESTELLKHCEQVIPFVSTADLKAVLENLSAEKHPITGVFHAAAVSDFFLPSAGTGKIPTSKGSLTLTLEPTPKLLPLMRGWFPSAMITGWKFEASGDQEVAVAAGITQLHQCDTDICIVNGPSYGEGFGVLSKSGQLTHLADRETLCDHLAKSLQNDSE